MIDIFKALSIIMLIGISLLVNDNLLAFICTVISLIIYIAILKKENGQYLFANIRFLFIVFLFLYTNSYPFIRLYLSEYIVALDYLPVTNGTVERGMFLSNLFIMIYIVLSIWVKAFIANRTEKANEFFRAVKSYLINLEIRRYLLVFDLMALVLCINYINNILKSGVLDVIFSGVSRFEVIGMIEDQPYWVFMYFLVAYSCVIYTMTLNKIRFNDSKSRIMFLRISFLSLFWIIDILLGNRRLVSYILLYSIFYFIVTKKKKLSLSKVTLLISISIMFMLIGYLRTAGFSFYSANIENVINDSFGEFFVPINIFYYYLENKVQLLYGSSYLTAVLFLVPRSIWPDKPMSLAVDFANYFGGTMGYGFNPIAEAYINFDLMFVVLLPIILVFLLLGVEALSKKSIPVYIFVYIETMNFNRGEFSSTLIEFMIMYISFLFLVISQRKERWKGKI